MRACGGVDCHPAVLVASPLAAAATNEVPDAGRVLPQQPQQPASLHALLSTLSTGRQAILLACAGLALLQALAQDAVRLPASQPGCEALDDLGTLAAGLAAATG